MAKELDIGTLWLHAPSDGSQKILNFPTKYDYKHPSKIEYLERGLTKFRTEYPSYDIKSIAFPILGAQNGKLDAQTSISLMKKYLEDLPDIDIEIYLYDHEHFQMDNLYRLFLEYLEKTSVDPKNARVLDILLSRKDIFGFADIVEKKVAEEYEDGTTRNRSIATKQFLQKIITEIKKQNRFDGQRSLFDN